MSSGPAISTSTTTQPRMPSASSRSRASGNAEKQISQIEKSVTHLLVATKQLLETLTQWSRGHAQEEDVSDVYVRLGYEFNLACRAFNSIGVDTADLGNVPDLLRGILEDTLSQVPSPQALDHFLPRIRDIIVNLLHGLKRKQSKLRIRPSRDNVVTATEQPPAVASQAAPPAQLGPAAATGDGRQEREREHPTIPSASAAAAAPPSAPPSLPPVSRRSFRRDAPPTASSETTSSLVSSSTANSSLTIQPPTVTTPSAASSEVEPPPYADFLPPPPPPPKQHDALAALQRGGDLERRASRRFSAYQISKQMGASTNGVPVIPPPPQLSGTANRGQDYRESMKAVQSRGSTYRTRPTRKHAAEVSPSRSGTVRAPERIVEDEGEDSGATRARQHQPSLRSPLVASESATAAPTAPATPATTTTTTTPPPPPAATTTAAAAAAIRSDSADSVDSVEPPLAATVSGPLTIGPDIFPSSPTSSRAIIVAAASTTTASPTSVLRKQAAASPPPSAQPPSSYQSQLSEVEASPPPSKDLTLFLQYKTKIKKFVLPDADEQLTLARLQLAFIEKFAWHTHNDGLDLPEIYIQDPVSGVRHELEDLSDVKDRVVLVLNVEPLDEVKKHFDDGLGGLQKTLDVLRHQLDGQASLMQRFSDRQLETSKEMARMSAVPSTPRPSRTPLLAQGQGGDGASADDKSSSVRSSTPAPSAASIQQVQNMRRDIAVLRQTYSSMAADFSAAMDDIKSKADQVKQAAADATVPTYTGDAGRAHIVAGKKQLAADSEAILNRYDDVADVIEELRRDVVTRGVRPLPRQLDDIGKELSAVSKELNRLKEVVKREKPIWTKIWEQELELVMSEKQDLTHQDEVLIDLSMDLKESTGIFQLVEEAMRQQNLQAAQQQPAGVGPAALRPTPKVLAFDSDVDPHAAKEGMLDEVRGLKVNHQDRVEAIERAEKARQRELQSRKGGEFQREVEEFVGQGKLKKTGGADEVERRRKLADEKARKENWDHQEQRKIEMERKRQEKAAARAAAEEKNKAKDGERDEAAPTTGETTEPVDPTDDALNADNKATHQDDAARPPESAIEHTTTEADLPTTPTTTAATTTASIEVPSNHTDNSTDPASLQSEEAQQTAVDADADPAPAAKDDEAESENSASSKSANRANKNWWQPAVFT